MSDKKIEIEIYGDDIPLAGDGSPPPGKHIDELIKYLATVSHRFGNTRIHYGSIKWGAVALNAIEKDKDTVTISRFCADYSQKELENAQRKAEGYAGPSEMNERSKYIAELKAALDKSNEPINQTK